MPAPLAGQPTGAESESFAAPRLNSFSSACPPESGAGPSPVEPGQPPTRFEVWSSRVFLVIRVIFWIELGMLLIVLPWTRVWTESGLLLRWPALRALLQQNFVRGAASGLGLLDIWIGVWDAVHYHDPR